MKKKDLKDLRTKNYLDLKKKETDARHGLTETRVQSKMGQVKNVHLANSKRKDIARIMTFLRVTSKANIVKNDVKDKEKENED
ncbi:MAG: 50S ribosomal protein L29 [Patescibacteria group bacterium]